MHSTAFKVLARATLLTRRFQLILTVYTGRHVKEAAISKQANRCGILAHYKCPSVNRVTPLDTRVFKHLSAVWGNLGRLKT
jgi:hypothetical protein